MIHQSAKFYGASNLIDPNLNFSYLNASWVHGADDVFLEYNSALTTIHPIEFGLPIHLVANDLQLAYKGMNKFNAIPVGVPFVYTYPNLKEHHGSLFKRVYIPCHGIKNISLDSLYSLWIETAKKNRCDGVLIGANDYLNFTNMMSHKIPEGIKILCGANISDKNALKNIKDIFYSIEECVLDFPGSHIIYAIACGCKPIFIQNFSENNIIPNDIYSDILVSYPRWIRADIKKSLISPQRVFQIISNFSKLNIYELRDIADRSLGIEYRKTKEEIRDFLMPKNFRSEAKNFIKIFLPKLQYKVSGNIFFY
jgi:hypothetical protein